MWWLVGGIVVAGAAVRWFTGRNAADGPLERSEQIERAYAATRRGRPVPIASASDGHVVFRGKVSLAGTPLVTRLSQQPCVYRNLRVDDLALLGEAPSYRHPKTTSTAVLHERDAQSFLITDDTGTAEVRIDDAAEVSFAIAPHLSLKGRQLRTSAAAANALLQLGLAPFGDVVVTEAAIFVGDTITVAGVGMREVSPGAGAVGYRDLPMRFVVRGGKNDVLAILKK